MAKLMINDGKGNMREHELVDDVTTMGRGSGNIIQVKDKEASRNHCRVEKSGDGHRLVDAGSRNGTKVNETKVDNQTLTHGDKIIIGDFVLVYDSPTALTAEDLGATVDVAPIDEKTVNVQGGGGQPKYILDVTEGVDKGQTFELADETFTIGRHSANKYKIGDESASSYHAEVSKEPTGYFLTDLGSTNGTKVGGEKVVKTRLSPGSEITIGTTKIIFKNIGAATEEDEVFGTVVLDTERLERELAEDEAKSRAAFIKRLGLLGAAVAVVLVVILSGVLFSTSTGIKEPMEGNVVDNYSFDGGVDDRGDPVEWRTVGGRHTPWQVLKDMDRDPMSTSLGAVVVAREQEAAPNVYAECHTEVDISTDRSYTLGGYIRTDGAQGAYGFRARWIGPQEREATSQVYVMGAQTEWREIKRVVSPPLWARRAKVTCFAYGNRGKVYYDDVYLVPSQQGEQVKYDVPYGRIRVEPTDSGQFGVRCGPEDAVKGGGLFLLSAQDAESTQEIADPEEPQSEKGGWVFRGSIPEFIDFASVGYVEKVRPGEIGVVMEYELRSDRPLPLSRAGVRFTVTGSFGAGQMKAFNAEGKPVAKMTGRIPQARELVFEDLGGHTMAVHIKSEEGMFRVEPQGEERQIEVIWPGQVTIGKSPAKLAIEFNESSRFERIVVDKLISQVERAKSSGDMVGWIDGLKKIASMSDRFPDVAPTAQAELDELIRKIEGEFAKVEQMIQRLRAATTPNSRNLLASQVKDAIAKLGAKYSGPPYSDKVSELSQQLVEVVDGFASQKKEAAAEKLLAQILQFIKSENLPFAKALWQKMTLEYSDTKAYAKAKEADVPGLIKNLERLIIEREGAYKRLQTQVRQFLINEMYDEALNAIDGSSDYQRHKAHPKFKALRDDVLKRREAK